MGARWICGDEAKALGKDAKLDLLFPYLKSHGSGCMAYSTLQEGMEYFILEGVGYIAFHTIRHPVFAPSGKRFVLGDPMAATGSFKQIAGEFLKDGKTSIFYQISREFACALHEGFSLRMNEVGVEWDLDIPNYDLKGKGKSQLRQWINKAKKEGVEVFEAPMESMDCAEVKAISDGWIARKGGQESKIVIRPLSFENEPDVRYFWAKRDGKLIGLTGYDPLYSGGRVAGYYHDHVRTTEDAPHGTSDLMNMTAIEKFKAEGYSKVTLGMSPLSMLEDRDLHYRRLANMLMKFMRERCNNIYPFKGNYFHKSRYCGSVRKAYIGTTSSLILPDTLAILFGVC